MSEELVLKTVGLTKHYGGVRALEGADFQLKKLSLIHISEPTRRS